MKYLIKTYNLNNTKSTFALFISALILINVLSIKEIFSQSLIDNPDEYDIRNFKEDLYIRTDRDIYITGEQVWFKVYKITGLTHIPCSISKVVYLELLDKNRFPLKQLKVKVDNNSGSSGFILPDNISSGNYIIRAYTNWMQNFSTDQFFCKTISVINPFESIDHLKLPQYNMYTDTVQPISEEQAQTFATDQSGNPTNGRSVFKLNDEQINFIITLEQPEYSTRGKVKMNLSAIDGTGNPVETDLSVSVAKSVLVSSTILTSFYNINQKYGTIARVAKRNYLAELEGHIISGHMRFKATDEPLKKTDISLSYVGKTARCQFGKTDENGEFNFIINETGLNEIVIQPLSSDITGYYIELDQPFSNTFSNFKPVAFYLDSTKINGINNAIISMQITDVYESLRQHPAEESKTSVADFYGKPENTIIMSDYIELGSIKEVVKEIIPNVSTLKQNGKYEFKLINKFRGQPFENRPLVLVDGVPIYDFDKVLSINSKEIERADINNTRYFYSDNVFDGIVSFISKKGNLSVLEFDNSIFRQDYEACQIHNDFFSPDYSIKSIRDNRIPDFRNTLYWNPDLHTGKDGKAVIEFFTSDESVEYTIVAEGISFDGKTGFSKIPMVVK
jgi:hypothetical protein